VPRISTPLPSASPLRTGGRYGVLSPIDGISISVDHIHTYPGSGVDGASGFRLAIIVSEMGKMLIMLDYNSFLEKEVSRQARRGK
jgi:hypothetical protein